jgi:hypothetical protein
MPGLKSILNPSQSVAIGVGIGAVDVFVFQQHLPPMADVRTANPHNDDVDAARRQATGLCIAINGLVSVMTRDWNVFLIGGVVTVGLSYLTVHANALNPVTGKLDAGGAGGASINPEEAAYNLPDYSADTEQDAA